MPAKLPYTEFASCRVAFSMERGDGEIYAETDAGADALFALSGDGWSFQGTCGGVCGNIAVVEFDHIPSPTLLKTAQKAITSVMRAHSPYRRKLATDPA